ncbi:hypothetical protein Tco_0472192 [Tanacetum coccineum]
MSSITDQQAKLDLELDALALTPCYSAFLITVDVPEVYMHQFGDSVYKHVTFYRFKIDKRKRFKLTLEIFRDIFKICPRVQGQDFDALPTDEEIMSFLRDLGHTGKSIHSMMLLLIRCINPGELLLHSLIEAYLERQLEDFINQIDNKAYKKQDKIPEMKETKAYKTYIGFASASTEEPTGNLKRVKRPAKKSTQALARGVLIRETPEIPVSKKKEKVDVVRGKGIELLSDVALTKETQYEEVRKKSMRDFHKTHPSGSGTATKPTPSALIVKPSVTNEGTGVKPGVLDVTEEESSESEAESWGNDDDDSNNDQDSRSEESDQDKDSDDDKSQSDNKDESDSEHETNENESDEEEEEIVKTLSDNSDDEDEAKIADKVEGGEDEEIDYTTSMLYDDVDIRMNEPVDADKGYVQEEGTDAAMTNVQQGNENPEISQVIKDDHVTLSTVPQKTEVPVSSSSRSSDLAAKFLNFLDIPTTEAKIISPLDVPVHHEVPSQQTPTLLTVPISVISDSSHVFSTVIPQSLQSFTPPSLLSTPTPPPITEATNPPSTLPDFALVFQFNNRVTALEQEVVELKKDPLHTQVTTLVDEHLDVKLGATRDEFINFLLASLTARITEQVNIKLTQIMPLKMSNFAPP